MITPVVLTIFNNPDTTRRVFEAIRAAQPSTLFLISDAGRTPAEQRIVEEARAVVEHVDWKCDVYKDYADINMGPKLRLSSGISWVFSKVDRAIILEHDCLPEPSFFLFCEELLEKYKNDTRIMHISGDNFQANNPTFACTDSYYFSRIPSIWGWATWARAWKHYDVHLSGWPDVEKTSLLSTRLRDEAVVDHWRYRFAQYSRGEVESWDGQWVFACLAQDGLCINPSKNLISNIGFGPRAFTTKDPLSVFANMPTTTMPFPLIHPASITVDADADAHLFKYNFDINRTWVSKLRWIAKRHLPKIYTCAKFVFARRQGGR